MNKWITRTIIVIIVGAVGFFGYRYFFGEGADATANGENTAEFTTVFRGDLSAGATAAGQLIAQREADLVLQTTGTVAIVDIGVGDNVTAGDLLVQLDTANRFGNQAKFVCTHLELNQTTMMMQL